MQLITKSEQAQDDATLSIKILQAEFVKEWITVDRRIKSMCLFILSAVKTLSTIIKEKTASAEMLPDNVTYPGKLEVLELTKYSIDVQWF